MFFPVKVNFPLLTEREAEAICLDRCGSRDSDKTACFNEDCHLLVANRERAKTECPPYFPKSAAFGLVTEEEGRALCWAHCSNDRVAPWTCHTFGCPIDDLDSKRSLELLEPPPPEKKRGGFGFGIDLVMGASGGNGAW